jgi:phage virion morphogenesis protein
MTNTTINDAEVFQLIKQLQARGDDMSPVMKTISVLMNKSVEENFEREGRPRWPALKPATITARAKKGKWPGKMLQVSGLTAASWTRSSNRTQAIVGSNYKIAKYHELGTVRMPARPVRTLTARDIGEIRYALLQFLLSKQ